MATTSNRRRRYESTPEERQAAAERDARVSAEAERLLADPAEVAKLVDRLLHSGLGPKLLSYSLANQALVISQCVERGIPLSDVAGRRTWNQRGRIVRGPGIRITAFRGDLEENTDTTSPDTNGGAEAGAESGGGEPKKRRPRFRMTSVWARAQTEDAFAAKEPDEEPVPDAARVLLASVTEQLQRHGYRVVEDTADSEPRASHIDHDAHTVAVAASWSARDRLLGMTLGLAQILTRAAERNAARRAG